jgi:xanthine dehydrogenase accessory factor
MALVSEGDIAGSVSGGCVEGAVFEAGVESLSANRPRLLSFGVADETAWDVGLACGGLIRVFVEPLDKEWYQPVRDILQANQSGVCATIIGGSEALLGRKLILDEQHTVVSSDLPAELIPAVVSKATAALDENKGGTTLVESSYGSLELFCDLLLPAEQLVMVGGVHITIALAAMAGSIGFRSIVIDPRRAFGSEARFPHVDALIQAWPQKAFEQLSVNRSTAVVMLTHDPKIDDPALIHVLQTPAFYIGALGSQRTHAQRCERLLRAGVPPEALARVHAPIGLSIGAQTPEEIAVAILAEIVAARHQVPTARES